MTKPQSFLPTKKEMDDLYADVAADTRNSMAETDALVQRDIDQYFDDLDFEHRMDVQGHLAAREMNESLAASISASAREPHFDFASTPSNGSNFGSSNDALARGTQALNTQIDRAMQQYDGVGAFGRDLARMQQPVSQIDPTIDKYLGDLYDTRNSLAARLQDPNILVGTDQARWQQSPSSATPGRVVVRPDGSHMIEDGGYLKPVSGGQELMLDQQQAFDRLDRAYNEIPLDLRQKSMSTADMLTLVSLAAGAGEVVAVARGASTLAYTLGALGNGAEYASDILRADRNGVITDVATNELFDKLADSMPSRGIQTALAVQNLALDSAQALQRISGPYSRPAIDARISDRDWALSQGINPMVMDFDKP